MFKFKNYIITTNCNKYILLKYKLVFDFIINEFSFYTRIFLIVMNTQLKIKYKNKIKEE